MAFLEEGREKQVEPRTLDTEMQWECETRQGPILSESKKVEMRNDGVPQIPKGEQYICNLGIAKQFN